MKQDTSEEQYVKALKHIPYQTPPAELWGKISQQIENQHITKQGWPIFFSLHIKWAGALFVLLLATSLFFLFPRSKINYNALNYYLYESLAEVSDKSEGESFIFEEITSSEQESEEDELSDSLFL